MIKPMFYQSLMAGLSLVLVATGYPANMLLEGRAIFQIGSIDLNGDQSLDALVILNRPYWYGTGGCTMLIFEQQGRLRASAKGQC